MNFIDIWLLTEPVKQEMGYYYYYYYFVIIIINFLFLVC